MDSGDDDNDGGDVYDNSGMDYDGAGFGGVDADAFAVAGEGAERPTPSARMSLEAAFQSGNVSITYEDLCKKHIVSLNLFSVLYILQLYCCDGSCVLAGMVTGVVHARC